MNCNKQKIIVLGGGTAGWVTAAVLSKQLDVEQYQITVIESEQIKRIGVGEASIPPIYGLIDFLGIDDKDLIVKTNASFKYGIHFENWSNPGESYMHAFGVVGTPFHELPFSTFWLQNAHRLNLNSLIPFSPSSMASYKGVFSRQTTRPANVNSNAFYPLCNLCYALHFDAKLLGNYLRDYSLERGVEHVVSTVSNVNCDAVNGSISSLELTNGLKLAADIFVDCSGTRAELIQKTLKATFEDWSQYLPCNRAVTLQTKAISDNPNPFTKSIAHQFGWQWQIPLQTRTGNGYVFNSRYISDEEALATLVHNIEGERITQPVFIPFKTGRITKPWTKNCIAIGLSSGFLEPLESTSIHMIYKYAIRLAKELDSSNNLACSQESFNSDFCFDTETIRDFLVMHYHVNQRTDSPFWLECQSMKIPSSLQDKLQEFTETGAIKLHKGELFCYESWLQVLVGQKYLTDYSRFSDNKYSLLKAQDFFKNVQHAVLQEINKLQKHGNYLKNL